MRGVGYTYYCAEINVCQSNETLIVSDDATMETIPFQLSVVSADQQLPSQLVNVESEWTTVDLKKYLSESYPGGPPIDSQKLIFAGQLLSDESKLRSVINPETISRTVHLVLSPAMTNQAKAALEAKKYDAFNFEPEELEKLRLQYIQYLEQYNQAQSVLPVNLQRDGDDDDEELNVEIEVREQPELPRPNFFQRMLGFRGFQQADDNPQNNEMGGEHMDIFDFAYIVFRISFMVAICVSYASWQRIFLVATVALFFHWRNAGRGNRRVVPRPVIPPQEVAPEQAHPTEQDGQPTATPVLENQADSSPSATMIVEDAAQSSLPVEPIVVDPLPPGTFEKLTEILRQVGIASVRLTYTIFASLVPELPGQVE